MQEGSKVDEAKCGTKIKAACGTNTTINKCAYVFFHYTHFVTNNFTND